MNISTSDRVNNKNNKLMILVIFLKLITKLSLKIINLSFLIFHGNTIFIYSNI